jgi:hypothetical protein
MYIRMHLSYRDQYNASLSHLFVHGVVHQQRHARDMQFFYYCVFTVRSMHMNMMVPGCMLVWSRKGAFCSLIPVRRIRPCLVRKNF